MKKQDTDRDSHTLRMITREVGLLEMEDPRVTPDDMRWAESVAASIQLRAAEHRRDRAHRTCAARRTAPRDSEIKTRCATTPTPVLLSARRWRSSAVACWSAA